ncbi:hypothetical protein EDC01DRAFT_136690 [Geopyxis carbonaria]|nr:hypothetical protein EDC01DRAFT_136690 [Geopyxis carbonaria]
MEHPALSTALSKQHSTLQLHSRPCAITRTSHWLRAAGLDSGFWNVASRGNRRCGSSGRMLPLLIFDSRPASTPSLPFRIIRMHPLNLCITTKTSGPGEKQSRFSCLNTAQTAGSDIHSRRRRRSRAGLGVRVRLVMNHHVVWAMGRVLPEGACTSAVCAVFKVSVPRRPRAAAGRYWADIDMPRGGRSGMCSVCWNPCWNGNSYRANRCGGLDHVLNAMPSSCCILWV